MRPAAAGLRGLNASQATTRKGQFVSYFLLRKSPYLTRQTHAHRDGSHGWVVELDRLTTHNANSGRFNCYFSISVTATRSAGVYLQLVLFLASVGQSNAEASAIVAQLAEHNLPKVGVTGSSPAYRSTRKGSFVIIYYYISTSPIRDGSVRICRDSKLNG